MLLNKHNLAVGKFASKSQIRKELASILIKDGKTVATDSFRLVEIALPKADPTEYPNVGNGRTLDAEMGEKAVMIPARTALTFKPVKAGKSLPILNHIAIVKNGEEHELYNTNLTDSVAVPIEVSDGDTFPKYEQIISDCKPVAEIQLDAQYLAEIAAFMAKLGSGHITLKLCGARQPVLIESNNDKQPARALLMPLNR